MAIRLSSIWRIVLIQRNFVDTSKSAVHGEKCFGSWRENKMALTKIWFQVLVLLRTVELTDRMIRALIFLLIMFLCLFFLLLFLFIILFPALHTLPCFVVVLLMLL